MTLPATIRYLAFDTEWAFEMTFLAGGVSFVKSQQSEWWVVLGSKRMVLERKHNH
jgi:hypothetical protein